jgi:hypothetical protein
MRINHHAEIFRGGFSWVTKMKFLDPQKSPEVIFDGKEIKSWQD